MKSVCTVTGRGGRRGFLSVPEDEVGAEEGAVDEADREGVADEHPPGGTVVGVFHLVVALIFRGLAAAPPSLAVGGVCGGGREGVADGMPAGDQLVLGRLVQWVRPLPQARMRQNGYFLPKQNLTSVETDREKCVNYSECRTIFLYALEQLMQGASHWSQVRSLPVSTSRK